MQAKQCNTDTEQIEGKKIEQKSQSTCGSVGIGSARS